MTFGSTLDSHTGAQTITFNTESYVKKYKYLARQCVGKAKLTFEDYTRAVFGHGRERPLYC